MHALNDHASFATLILKLLRQIGLVGMLAFGFMSIGHAEEISSSNTDTPWTFEITPYVWAINMQGETQLENQISVIHQSFFQTLNQLDWGGMLWLDAKKDRWGIFLNSLYAVLSDDGVDGPFTTHTHTDLGLFSVGASYEAYRHVNGDAQFSVAPYLGARYTIDDVSITVPAINYNLSDNNDWTDPIVGVRLQYNFNKQWQAILAGDIGGTNTNTDKSYNVNGFVGYKPISLKNTTFYLGYRLLYEHYQTGSGNDFFLWSVKMYGPALGVSFAF